MGPRPTQTHREVDAPHHPQFDLAFFGALVDRALARPAGRREPETFVDVGSGCGRLVLAASCVWPELARAAGVETCADLHMMAVRAQARASLPRCDFVHGDALQAMREGGPLDDATVVFCYSSAWASEGGALTDFSELVGCCCLPGCRVVVTDKWLECDGSCGEFALIDEMEGPNRETGGSVGYIYEVVRSQRGG